EQLRAHRVPVLSGLELEDAIARTELEVQREGAVEVLRVLIDPLVLPQLPKTLSHTVPRRRSTPAESRVWPRRGRWSSPPSAGGFLPPGAGTQRMSDVDRGEKSPVRSKSSYDGRGHDRTRRIRTK